MFKALGRKLFEDPEGAPYLLRRLLGENLHRYKKQYAIAFVFMGMTAAAGAGSAAIMKDVINEVFINKDSTMVYVISLTVVGIFVMKGAASYGQSVVLSRIGNSVIAKLQNDMYAKITRLGVRYYDTTSFGDIATRFGQNTGAARKAMDTIVLAVGRDVMSVIGLVSVMVYQNPLLSLISMAIMPPAVFAVAKLVKRVKKIAKSQFINRTRILSTVKETAQGIRVIKSFRFETEMRDTMSSAVGDVEKQANKIAKLTARTSPLMETLGGIAVAAIIMYGGYSVIEMGQDPGAFFAFITALLLAYDPIKRLARVQVSLNNQLVGVRLMYELLDLKEDYPETSNNADLSVSGGEVVLDDVVFHYGDSPALNGLSLTAEAGKVTALVGSSGAGKSTVFAMLERFYYPQSGEILIDGQSINGVNIQSLRANMAIVTQDTFLFDRSVRDNIRIGKPDATDAEVEEAAKNANAHDFICELDQGYETFVGEGGGRLSGGQRQRIAIARAMLSDAKILLLDEATSALDAESEHKIQAALTKLMAGRTTIVIAHRLSTVREADTIHVLEKGRLLESGSHDELYAMDGFYRHLCKLQFTETTVKAHH
ncbi:ABC transporter ATP-binding protein [Flexibacterium corallicola]|uniref:ABC transporter ATP-binding protein n=1 Tax=Flexibacterium corallicola TaxID=3037259 RepID=UPI00286F54E7|nr:ABC transporter ATP-binding protein [Pseudovibrio sp. M1P-2-3]